MCLAQGTQRSDAVEARTRGPSVSSQATLCLNETHFLTLKQYGQSNSNEPRHEISNNVVCATSKCSDQPAHTRSLIIAFVSRLNIL